MNILVIGGNRFFGKTIVSKLNQTTKHKIFVMNRSANTKEFPKEIQQVKGDRSDTNFLLNCVVKNKIDVIIDQVLFEASEAEELLKVINSISDRKLSYLFISSQSVYGKGDKIEEDVFNPKHYKFKQFVKTSEDYGEAKKQAESIIFQGIENHRAVAFRFPIVLGEDDYTKRLDFHLEALHFKREVFIPNLDSHISFIYQEDAANAVIHFIDSDFHGPINVCSPDTISIGNLIKEMEKQIPNDLIIGIDPMRNYSPYGISSHWNMNTKLVQSLGFKCRNISDYLPMLIKKRIAKGF